LRAKRSNPFFLSRGKLDCFAPLAMTEREADLPAPVVIPAKAGIQYAAAYRFNHCYLWILDRPPSRTMTTEYAFAISRRAAPELCMALSL
jgi:hypothetical protein